MEGSGIFATPKRLRNSSDADTSRRRVARVDQTATPNRASEADDRIGGLAQDDEAKSTVIISVVENRSRETCVCKIDSSTVLLNLTDFYPFAISPLIHSIILFI